MLKVSFVSLATEKVQVTDLEVRPEVTGGVAIRISGVIGTELIIRQPSHHVVLGHIRWVRRDELFGFGPQIGNALRRIKQVDGKPVRDVVVLHIPEDIVVDITEELDLGLHTPVVAIVFQNGVLVKHATVPSAHQMVGHLVTVLDALLLQQLRRLMEDVHVNPIGDLPMLLGDLF